MDSKQQIARLLGLMTRAGKIVYGVKLVESIKAGKVFYVLIATDMGATQQDMLGRKCFHYQVMSSSLLTSQELSNAIGKENIKAIGVIDQGFSSKIKTMVVDYSTERS